ncbi:MAG: hypothetical protein CL678_11950 [Bdellovibrionaceae bacterium]|nr:hypothetical protein [Pseudobdellovibrionaceae bacterium]|tara:strand:- start:344 stop:1570 length:1227 start_codon:yes stop_codon:yes gene_type:complete
MSINSGTVRLITKRFLISKTTDGFLSFISWVSVMGVALGVFALVVVTSVINGFEGELVRVITSMNGDVILYTRGSPLSYPEEVISKIRKMAPEVEAVSPAFIGELMVAGPDGTSGAVVEGIDLQSIGRVTEIPNRIVSGKMPSAGMEVAIGKTLAEKIGASVGSSIRLIFPYVKEGEVSDPQPKVVEVVVSGLIQMGMYQYDSKFLFVQLQTLQKVIEKPGKVTTFHIRLKKGTDEKKVAHQLRESFGYPFRAKYWGELNKNLLYAIDLEKIVISIILTAIIIVAAFNVVSTLMMMIHDKGKEISILKAMGFPQKKVFQLFAGLGLWIGLTGVTLGSVGAFFALWVLKYTHWIKLPSDIYYIDFLPVFIRWKEVSLILVFAVLVCFIATLYPSWSITKKSPIDGIRFD